MCGRSLPRLQDRPMAWSISRETSTVHGRRADHDAWKAADYAPEQEFISKLSAIEGISAVETQDVLVRSTPRCPRLPRA